MYGLLKKILFSQDAEEVHHWVMRQLQRWNKTTLGSQFIKRNFSVTDATLHRKVFGLDFPNPVGLAAGFDKDAKYIDELANLGFGCVEIGTLTPKAQDGNEKPRLFRLPADQALINRMGFNNGGVDAAVERLKARKSKIIVGGNIGKNKLTPNEDAISDYEYCFRALYNYVDYFTINVSSPNTPGLRALQEKEPLQKLLTRLQIVDTQLGGDKPILLKIAPDLTRHELDDIVEIVLGTGIDGIVATNTTISRENLETSESDINDMGAGGLSGAPLRAASTDVVRYLSAQSKGKIKIIAAGGVFTAADAKEKFDAGASLVQVYTGFIYQGPAIVKQICKGL